MGKYKLHDLKAQLNNVEVIETLRKDKDSEHWQTCITYLETFIGNRFPNLLRETIEDGALETASLIYRNFSTFRGDSTFTTWADSIAHHYTVDMLRKQRGKKAWEVQVNDYGDEGKGVMNLIESGEDPVEYVLSQERLQELRADFEEFLSMRRKAERDREILHKIAQYYTYQEIAQELHINSPVVSSVVYAFRDFSSKKYPKK